MAESVAAHFLALSNSCTPQTVTESACRRDNWSTAHRGALLNWQLSVNHWC